MGSQRLFHRDTDRVIKAMQSNESQYAYRINSSTEQALVNVSEQIYKSIDKGKISLSGLLDLSKAFDSVNHDLLLNKHVQLNIDSTCMVRKLFT